MNKYAFAVSQLQKRAEYALNKLSEHIVPNSVLYHHMVKAERDTWTMVLNETNYWTDSQCREMVEQFNLRKEACQRTADTNPDPMLAFCASNRVSIYREAIGQLELAYGESLQ